MLQNYILAGLLLIDVDLDSRMLQLLNLTRDIIRLGLLLLVIGTCLLIALLFG